MSDQSPQNSSNLVGFLQKAYTEINSNISFGEAKNAALITLNSVLFVGLLTKAFNDKIVLTYGCLIAFISVALLIPMIISLLSFRAKLGDDKGIKKILVDKMAKKLYEKHKGSTANYLFYRWIYLEYVYEKRINKTQTYINTIRNKFPNSTETVDEYVAFEEEQLALQIKDLSAVAFGKFALFNTAISVEIWIFVILAAIVVFVA